MRRTRRRAGGGLRLGPVGKLHQVGQHGRVAAREVQHHGPIFLGKGHAPFAGGGHAFGLKAQGLAHQLADPFHHDWGAGMVETAPELVQGAVVEVLDEPVKLVFHLKVCNDIGVLFKIHRLHLQHLGPQRLQLGQGFGQGGELLADGGRLLGKRGGDLFRGIQADQAVFDVVQRKAQMLHGQDLVEQDHVPVGIEPAAAPALGRGGEQAFPVVILQGAHRDTHLFCDLAHGHVTLGNRPVV